MDDDKTLYDMLGKNNRAVGRTDIKNTDTLLILLTRLQASGRVLRKELKRGTIIMKTKHKQNKKISQKGQYTSAKIDEAEIGVVAGELLCTEIIREFIPYGSSPKALLVQAYALAKVWAFVDEMAHKRGVNVEDTARKLMPLFREDAKATIEELEELL